MPDTSEGTTTRALLAAIEQMDEGVVVTDEFGTILFVNAAAAHLYGTRLLGGSTDRANSPYQILTEAGEPYPSSGRPLARVVLRAETITNERWRIRRPDGTEILVQGSARPVVDDVGNRIGAVLTVHDDTAREKAERLERERNALARESHEAFQQSPVSSVMYDKSGKPIAVNTAFEQLWGITLNDLPPDYRVLDDPQLENSGHLPLVRRAFGLDGAASPEGAGEGVSLPPLRYEMSHTTGKGPTLWAEAHFFPVRDQGGNVERVFLSQEDASEKVAAQVAHDRAVGLQKLTAALSESSTTNEMSAAIVTHAAKVLGADAVIVFRELADNVTIELLDASGIPEPLLERWTLFPINTPVPIADVARTRTPLFMKSREQIFALYPHLVEVHSHYTHQANVILPLLVGHSFLGVLATAFEEAQEFDDDFRTMALTMAGLCAQALERARLFDVALSADVHDMTKPA